MEREVRYTVIKKTDSEQYLTATERETFRTIVEKLEARRITAGKRPLVCVVVEDDWPEYEQTWAAIAERVGTEDAGHVAATHDG